MEIAFAGRKAFKFCANLFYTEFKSWLDEQIAPCFRIVLLLGMTGTPAGIWLESGSRQRKKYTSTEIGSHSKFYRELFKSSIFNNEKSSSGPRYALKLDVTDEILMNKENYDTVFHRHTHRFVQTVDSDGQCRSTKHEPECYKNVDQQKKVSY